MLIFGWGHRTTKQYGAFEQKNCSRCNNTKQWEYIHVRTWFTLFFIPIIPYESTYARICPVCGNHDILGREQFTRVTSGTTTSAQVSDEASMQTQDHLTETQKNYIQQMEAHKKSKEQETAASSGSLASETEA